MKLVGVEERALWSAAVVATFGKVCFPDKVPPCNVDDLAASAAVAADAIVLEFRARNGSHP